MKTEVTLTQLHNAFEVVYTQKKKRKRKGKKHHFGYDFKRRQNWLLQTWELVYS